MLVLPVLAGVMFLLRVQLVLGPVMLLMLLVT